MTKKYPFWSDLTTDSTRILEAIEFSQHRAFRIGLASRNHHDFQRSLFRTDSVLNRASCSKTNAKSQSSSGNEDNFSIITITEEPKHFTCDINSGSLDITYKIK